LLDARHGSGFEGEHVDRRAADVAYNQFIKPANT
jgi:hypothetical protein